MKIKIAFILIICCILSLSLSACGHKHRYSKEWSYDSESHWHAAECEHKTLTQDKESHNFNANGKCTVCGYDKYNFTIGLDFKFNDDYKTYAVYVGTATGTKVVIPSEYEGKPVTKIGDGAFRSCNISSIVIPDSITTIGESAFFGCKNLKTLNLPDSVAEIGNYAFYESGLNNINIPAAVIKIGESAFYGCSGLSEVDFQVTEGWKSDIDFESSQLTDPRTAAILLKSHNNVWQRENN